VTFAATKVTRVAKRRESFAVLLLQCLALKAFEQMRKAAESSRIKGFRA
jgi:hypothetical protein